VVSVRVIMFDRNCPKPTTSGDGFSMSARIAAANRTAAFLPSQA
jgi:hypothetical protein